MAKLSAHGYEVARLVTARTSPSRRYDVPTDTWITFDARYEYHYSFRSDGHILRRIVGLDVHPDENAPSRRRHDWGWKLYRKLKDPKRDPARRLTALAHRWAVAAERRDGLVDLKAAPHTTIPGS